MKRFKNKTIVKILEKYLPLASLESLLALSGWDLNVYMPPGASKERGVVLGSLSVLAKKLLLDKDFLNLIKKAEKQSLNDYEKGVIRVLKREVKKLKKLPDDFIREFQETTNQAQVVWRKAKKENNFKKFQPYLEKIVVLNQKKAEYLGYPSHPYDALVDLYEEGWTTDDFEKFFTDIKEPLKELFFKIRNSPLYIESHPIEKEEYQKAMMESLNHYVLSLLGFDPNYSRLDVAPHPFTETITLSDVRITTWYHRADFRRSLMATIHEFGHSIYELKIDPELKFTPLQGGLSYAFHESQSRFWENIVGRNKNFLKKLWPKAKTYLPFLKNYSFADFYQYLNLVRPELIRVEADEITYHFHIILRFELEKELLEEKIKVKDLPVLWQEKMKSYLGVKPKKDSQGVLQDIHWSMGAIGYFPTYSLGSFLSGLWYDRISKELGKIDEVLKQREGVKLIQEWLRKKIYCFGKTYPSKVLIKKITKKDFGPKPFLDYLNQKYSSLYHF